MTDPPQHQPPQDKSRPIELYTSMDLESFLRAARIPPIEQAAGWYANAFVISPARGMAPPARGELTLTHEHCWVGRMRETGIERSTHSTLTTEDAAALAITYRAMGKQPFLAETAFEIARRYGFPQRATEHCKDAFHLLSQIDALSIDRRYGLSAREISPDSHYAFSDAGMRAVWVTRTAVQSDPKAFSAYFPLVVPARKRT